MMLHHYTTAFCSSNSTCDGCAREAEENRMRREFGQQNVATERMSVTYTFR